MPNFISFPISAANPFAQDRDLPFLVSWYSEDVAGFLLDVTTHALLDARGQKATAETFCAVAGVAMGRARQHDAVPDASCRIEMSWPGQIAAQWSWGKHGARPFFGFEEVCRHGQAGSLRFLFDHGSAVAYYDQRRPWIRRRIDREDDR